MDDLFTTIPAPYMADSDTSRNRAKSEDATGVTSNRQRVTLDLLEQAGRRGLTWRELSELTGWHHGQSSGTLSTLHREGWAFPNQSVTRENCHPYTGRRYTDADALTTPAKTRATRHREALEAVAEAARQYLKYRVQDTHSALVDALNALDDLS